MNFLDFAVDGQPSESGFTRGCLDYSKVQHPEREPKPEGKGEVCREYSISGGIAKVVRKVFKKSGERVSLGCCLPLQFCRLQHATGNFAINTKTFAKANNETNSKTDPKTNHQAHAKTNSKTNGNHSKTSSEADAKTRRSKVPQMQCRPEPRKPSSRCLRC